MKHVKLLQAIGNEVCEGCGPDCDCGEDPESCYRILNASILLTDYVIKLGRIKEVVKIAEECGI